MKSIINILQMIQLMHRATFVAGTLGVLLVSAAITFGGCRTTSDGSTTAAASPGSGAPKTGTVNIKGSEADQFGQALTDAGVKIQPGDMGLQGLAAQSVTCHDDHTSVSPQECVVTTAAGDPGVTTGPAAGVLFKVLKTHAGGQAHNVTATDVSCHWVRNATANATICQFTL